MAAIELRSRLRRVLRALSVFSVLVLMIAGYQNCSVDLANTTPGASVRSSCSPPQQALEDFEPVLNDLLQAQGAIGASASLKCGTCHTLTGTHDYAAIGRSVFLIQQGDTAANPEILKTNYCTVADRAEMLSNKLLNGPHTGGLYQASEVQILLTYLQTYF